MTLVDPAGATSPAASPDPIDRLEALFGDAGAAGNPVGREAVLAADADGSMLAAGEDLLDAFGLNAHFVPEALGGRFAGPEELIGVMRAVYRRDPALGLGYGAGSFMAAVNVWTSGSAEQQSWLAGHLLSGGRVACGYHELAHGNDFARAELTALPGPDGQLLVNGRKEVVANLARAGAVVLFARTDAAAGSRSHSQLLLETARLASDTLTRLPRFATVGMRGVPLGGIEFTDCPVPADAVVGTPGHGLETAQRSFQLTRIALPGMTLGLLDTALRTALRGALGRRLYAGTAADLSLSRTVLAEAFADLLLADAFVTVAARAAHTAPGQSTVYASAVKLLVPALVMGAVSRLSELLGSQFYLRAAEQPLFQKLQRDVLPSAFGHASRVSCQAALLPQLPLTVRRTWSAEDGPALPPTTFRPGEPLPPLDFGALKVTAGGRDPLSRSLLQGAERPTGRGEDAELAARASQYATEIRALSAEAARLTPDQLGPAAPPHAFDLTTRWAGVLAAAACLGLWWERPGDGQGPGAEPAWVLAALHRLGVHTGRHHDPLPEPLSEFLYAELLRRHDAGLTFDHARRPTGA
ncbi:acyl-CoA dehydrogenase family protein [Streptomyces avidinii]|uniref:Alkylation response protein AidB-like acyl-CoA dehydrogenase n=1 Tax=Streptomyces avidinii TaxID=1895 RepID=A0ABS4L913_STRAV|nr:acyl-CoA dehydrogenase family protein [Streptomyces avidinii]MBP2038605.1 alkylation response protein AidB-like acyl-CoA dehydrogenase [Streptomyces avidinii]GGZ23537.1 acyl-CoA dehydrogenase [Streptomyces avidinii]